jgi:Zn-dependent protease/CBS domain-containing protein
MRQSLRLGRVAGTPVGAHWTVAVILVIITGMLAVTVLPAGLPDQPAVVDWAVAAAAAVVFAGSLLAHELSHALVARRNGVRVRSITLWMLGGVAELEGDPPDPGADLRIALAGPAASAAAAVVFGGVAAAIGYGGGPRVAAAAAAWLAVMNGLLAVFNLLPGAPLDGGRVLRAALWRRYGDRGRAGLAAARAGRVVGAVIAFAGVAGLLALGEVGGLWLLLVGWFLVSAASAEAGTIAATTALAGLRVADVMTPDPDIGPAWATAGDFIANVAARSGQGVFPVVDFDGGLAGLVFSDLLARIPADDRSALRLGQVAVAVPPACQAAPGDPAAALLTRPPLRGEVAAVVLDHGRVAGLVTTADLRAALRRARLRPPAAPAGGARRGRDTARR